MIPTRVAPELDKLIRLDYKERDAGNSPDSTYYIVATEEYLEMLQRSPAYSINAMILAEKQTRQKGRLVLYLNVRWCGGLNECKSCRYAQAHTSRVVLLR